MTSQEARSAWTVGFRTRQNSQFQDTKPVTLSIIYQQMQCMHNLIFRCIRVVTVTYIKLCSVANINWTMQQLNWSVQKGNNWRLESRHVFFSSTWLVETIMLPKFQYEVKMKTTIIGSANILFIWVLKWWYKTHTHIYYYIHILFHFTESYT